MIKIVKIQQFKSIAKLVLEPRRVNLFIGKPNVGKSNILEAIALLGLPYAVNNIKEVVRIETAPDLFYDQDTAKKISIEANEVALSITFEGSGFKIDARGREGDGFTSQGFMFQRTINYDGNLGSMSQGEIGLHEQIKFYKFLTQTNFPGRRTEFLWPPYGNNLMVMLQVLDDLKKVVADLLAGFGFRLLFKQQEGKIEIAKQVGDVIITYPYSLVSDTLQRVIFYYAAMLSNKDSVLIFEEPESNSFPYYTKFMAERIALDTPNQYFISTHNPYLLSSIAEKTPKDELAIFVVYFDDYQTKAVRLSGDQVQEVIDLDASIFFNLEKYTEKS
ncbi:MAG: hypothetical protein G01um101433_236 [Parcubacteria group bacterium Gr01-1014_33]|nr:MAG: hypothetical protein G01um101433_236 [Parcubacteria group bacterium Gr01-1014_33]